MSKMKKLLALSLVTVSVVGCGTPQQGSTGGETSGNADGNTGGNTSTISVQVEGPWRTYYESAIARVKETYPDATINLIETGSFDNLDTIDSTDITNKDVADVFAIPIDRVYGLAQNEALASIDAPAIADEIGGFGTYDEGLGGSFKIDGNYLAFPMNIETLVAFVNTANAEASGIDVTQKIEFTEIGFEDMLVLAHDAWFGVSFANAANMNLLSQVDGGFATDLTKPFAELTGEQQEVFTALFEYWQAHNEAGTDLWDKDAAGGYIDSSFTSGNQTAVRIDGPWATPAMLEKTNNGADLAVLSLSEITVAGNPLTHWQGGWGLAVNARLEGKEAEMALAEEMIKELVNTEYAVELFETTGKILPNVTADVYEKSDLPEADKAVIARTLDSYATSVARPLFTEWGQVWPTWQNALLSWSASKPATVEEAYEQVQAAFEAMMANL